MALNWLAGEWEVQVKAAEVMCSQVRSIEGKRGWAVGEDGTPGDGR